MKCEARCEVESIDIRIDEDHSIVEKNIRILRNLAKTSRNA
jgi:hypothetical protein